MSNIKFIVLLFPLFLYGGVFEQRALNVTETNTALKNIWKEGDAVRISLSDDSTSLGLIKAIDSEGNATITFFNPETRLFINKTVPLLDVDFPFPKDKKDFNYISDANARELSNDEMLSIRKIINDYNNRKNEIDAREKIEFIEGQTGNKLPSKNYYSKFLQDISKQKIDIFRNEKSLTKELMGKFQIGDLVMHGDNLVRIEKMNKTQKIFTTKIILPKESLGKVETIALKEITLPKISYGKLIKDGVLENDMVMNNLFNVYNRSNLEKMLKEYLDLQEKFFVYDNVYKSLEVLESDAISSFANPKEMNLWNQKTLLKYLENMNIDKSDLEQLSLDKQLSGSAFINIFNNKNQLQKTLKKTRPEFIDKIFYDIRESMFKGFDNNENMISEEECKQMSSGEPDNGFEKQMGMDMDQGSTGTCWIHAASKLLEQQLCKQTPSLCGENVSRFFLLSVTRIDKDTGGNFKNAFDAIGYNLGNICLNKYAPDPYNELSDDYVQRLQQLYENLRKDQNCQNQTTLIKQNIDLIKTLNNYVKRSVTKSNLRLYEKYFKYKPLKKSRIKDIFDMTLELQQKDIFNNEDSLKFFVKEILLHHCNKYTDVKLDTSDLEYNLFQTGYSGTKEENINGLNINKEKMKSMIDTIIDITKSGNALIVNMCYEQLLKQINIMDSSECGGHAIVISNFKWNKKYNRCDAYVINSHGKNATIPTNWYPATAIFKTTMNLQFFKEKVTNP